MWRQAGAGISIAVLIGGITSLAAPTRSVFDFLDPVVHISDADQKKLDHHDVILDLLPAKGHEVAVMVAGGIDVDASSFIESIRHIAALQRGPLVPEIARFSREPRIEDLRDLTLDSVDVHEIEKCRPDDCGLKLSPEQVRRLQHARPIGAENKGDSITREFRQILLEHAKAYQRQGEATTQSEFPALLQHAKLIQARAPQLVAYFEDYPADPLPGAESFLYWSKAKYAWKPIITISQMTIVHGDPAQGWPEVFVVSRDVYASRYTSGAVGLSMLFRNPQSSQRYLVYVNRTWVDALHWLWRPFVNGRIKAGARKAFATVRQRIESQAIRSAQ